MKTVLCGMNNPLGAHPRLALWPHPPNCTGWRVWRMLDEASVASGLGTVTEKQYREGFERVNVLDSVEWSAREASRSGREKMDSMTGRRIVFFGVRTLKAVGLPRSEWGVWREYHWLPAEPMIYCILPHPSGRCREYNDPEVREMAGRVLLREYLRGREG